MALIGQSVKVPLKTSVSTAQIALELVESVADSKDAIVDRVKDIGRVIDFGLASVEVGTRAGISSALGRKVEKSEMATKESRDQLAEELWMPKFDASVNNNTNNKTIIVTSNK